MDTTIEIVCRIFYDIFEHKTMQMQDRRVLHLHVIRLIKSLAENEISFPERYRKPIDELKKDIKRLEGKEAQAINNLVYGNHLLI